MVIRCRNYTKAINATDIVPLLDEASSSAIPTPTSCKKLSMKNSKVAPKATLISKLNSSHPTSVKPMGLKPLKPILSLKSVSLIK